MPQYTIELPTTPHEMAREEIRKQVAFLSKNIRDVRFDGEGKRILFEGPDEQHDSVQESVKKLATRIERALRNVERKVIFRSKSVDSVRFDANPDLTGIHFLGMGQVALSGVPLQLYRYFDRVFEDFGRAWNAVPVLTPTLIPSGTLSRCDYFRSFPQTLTFAAHLREDTQLVEEFRARHATAEDLDDKTLADLDRPEACLSPAVCYHVYHLQQDRTVPTDGLVYSICGKCFRYESTNLSDLRRLWDFTMREVVFLGSREQVLKERERSIQMMADFLDSHELAGEIRTASDPFFISPDAVSKTYFQLSSESKFEVSLLLPHGERTAVGSHNYHSDFFGRAFHTDVADAGPMHSVCVAFGIERWVHAFLQQHGSDAHRWPEPMRRAPEFL
jgi:seryl-tRNA synthetase